MHIDRLARLVSAPIFHAAHVSARHATLRFALCGLALLWALTSGPAQQPPRNSASHPTVSRVGCVSCPASLRIIVDVDSTVSVDGEKVGRIAKDTGRTVAVGLGEHVVVAQAGDLKWQTNLTVDKPGQRLINTDLHSVDRTDRLSKPWQGDWRTGRHYYSANVAGVDGEVGYYFDSVEIKVDGLKCTYTWEQGSNFSFNGPPSSYTTRTDSYPCSFGDDGSLIINNNAKATGEGSTRNLTYTKDQTYSLPLYNTLNGQGNARDEVDPFKIADQAKRAMISQWQGRWVGEYEYDGFDGRVTYRRTLTVEVDGNGSCNAGWEGWNDSRLGGDFSGTVSIPQFSWSCSLVDEGRIHVGKPYSDMRLLNAGHAIATYTDPADGQEVTITMDQQ